MIKRTFDKYKNNLVINRFIKFFTIDALVKNLGLFLLPVYLTLMTQEEYATFSYVSSIIGTFGLVFNFGLYVPQSKIYHDLSTIEFKGSLLYTINVLLFVFLTVFLLPMYVFGWDYAVVKLLFSHSINYSTYRYIVLIGLLISVYAYMISNFFMTEERIRTMQTYSILRLILGTGIVLGALYWISGDKATIRLEAFYLVEALLVISFFSFYVRAMRPKFDWAIALNSLHLALPIMMSAILGIIINFGDKFFIEKYCSLADLSVYFLSITCAGVIPTMFMTFQNIWMPLFLKEKNLAVNVSKTKKTFWILLAIFVVLAICIWVGVFVALSLNVINSRYFSVLNLLPIVLATGIVSSLNGLLSSYTVYWNMTYVTIISGIVIGLCSIPLNLYTVKSYGVYGIASSGLIINITYIIFYYVFIKLKIKSLCRV